MKYKFIVLLLIAFSLTSCEQKINYAGVFEIEALDDDTVCICNTRRDYDSNRPHLSGIVRIPKTVYGRKVVKIGAKAFSECNEVIEFIIPNTVRIIDEKAFENCTSLRSVIFEEPSGWKANSNNLTLTDPHQNALYLTTIYSLYTWQHE